MLGRLHISPACVAAPIHPIKKEILNEFYYASNSESFSFSISEFQWWCFLGFASIIDNFDGYFRAVLVARIDMMKCPESSKSKISQTLKAPPDPTCVTLRPKKFYWIFIPPDSCLFIFWTYTLSNIYLCKVNKKETLEN